MKGIFLLLAAVLVAAGPQDKVKLEVKTKKGDKATVSSTDNNHGKIKIVAGEQEQELDIVEKFVMKYKDEVLEVEGGAPTRVKRQFTEFWEEKKQPLQDEAEKESMTLEGKTVTLVKKGDETVVEGAEDVPEKEIRKNRLRTPAFQLSLPKDEVAVGATWDVDEKALLKDFNEDVGEGQIEFKTAKAKGKLAEVKSDVASITYDVEATGELQGGIKVTLKMKVTSRLNVKTNRLVDMKSEGSADIKGEGEQGGQAFSVDGKFELKGEQTWTYE